MSADHAHATGGDRPATFYASPAEAHAGAARGVRLRRRPPRGHGGRERRTSWPSSTSIRSPTPTARSPTHPDAERRRRAAPLRLAGCSTACHGDRTAQHLVVPGFRSSRHPHPRTSATTPAARRSSKVIEPDEIVAARPATPRRTPSTACPAEIVIVSMLGDAQRRRAAAASRCSTPRLRRARAAGRPRQRRASSSTTTSGTSPARTRWSPASGRAQHVRERASTWRT